MRGWKRVDKCLSAQANVKEQKRTCRELGKCREGSAPFLMLEMEPGVLCVLSVC